MPQGDGSRDGVCDAVQIAEVAKRGRAVLKANARRFAPNVRPIIEEIMRAGATSHNAIAAKLNKPKADSPRDISPYRKRRHVA